MGIRSRNYLALSAEAKQGLPSLLRAYLGPAVASTESGAALFVFESNEAPMWVRDSMGASCAFDLEVECLLQRHLGKVGPHAFRLVRVGERTDHRGKWYNHPFHGHEEVMSIQQDFHEDEVPDAVDRSACTS